MTTASGHAPAEERVEQMVGNLLRIGVLVAAAVALLGGIAQITRLGGVAIGLQRGLGVFLSRLRKRHAW